MLAVCPLITPAPRGPLLRRCVIIAILARTAPCASLGSTRELPASRLYRGFYETKTFPALPLRPCDRAATHTPGSSLGAFARHFPKDPAFTVITAARRSQFPATAFSRGWVTTLQRSRYVAARSLARPPGQSRLATARALSSELSPRWSPNPDVRFATWLSGCYHGRSFPGWSETFPGCTLLPPSLLLRPHAPVSCPPANFPPRGYIASLTDRRPSLRCISGLATMPPPLHRRAPQRHPPDSSLRILPSPA